MPTDDPVVLVAEPVWANIPEWFTARYETVMYETWGPDLAQRLAECPQAWRERVHALIVRNRARVDETVLRLLPELRCVGRLGSGTDNIDLPHCQRRDVEVLSAPGVNAVAVAEYVVAAMLWHVRALHRADALSRSGWRRVEAIGHQLAGRTLGLVGVGEIGRRVARRAAALGMRVIATDPVLHPAHELVEDGVVTPVTLDELLERSHVVSVHVPLDERTRHLIGRRELQMLRHDALIIQASRGGVIDEEELHKALLAYPDRAAVIDVREQEPPPQPDPLAELPNVLLTPHIAGLTRESCQAVADWVFQAVDRCLSCG